MMHFVKAGRGLIEPLVIDEALCRAIYRRPSADVKLFVNNAGETMATVPWESEGEAIQKVAEFVHASVLIHKLLMQDHLRTYVLNPTVDEYLRVPRHYWLRAKVGGPYRLQPVEGATGWDDALVGQPILVDSADLQTWEQSAAAAVLQLRRTEAGSPATTRTRARVPSPKQRALTAFLKLREERSDWAALAGDPLFSTYGNWCRKNGKASFGRSQFFELLAKIRD